MRNVTPTIKQDIINKDKEKYAYEFSEGNHSLEKCLLKLWNEGFETIGCCRGHDNHKAYIGLKLDEKAIKFLSNIKKENIIITFLSFINEKTNNLHYSIKEINSNKIFNNIINSFDKDNKIDNDIMVAINFILKKHYGYINIRIYYKKTTTTYIVTDNLELIKYFLKHNEKSTILDKYKHLYSFKIRINDLLNYLN